MLIKQHNLWNPWGDVNQLAREFDQLLNTHTQGHKTKTFRKSIYGLIIKAPSSPQSSLESIIKA